MFFPFNVAKKVHFWGNLQWQWVISYFLPLIINSEHRNNTIFNITYASFSEVQNLSPNKVTSVTVNSTNTITIVFTFTKKSICAFVTYNFTDMFNITWVTTEECTVNCTWRLPENTYLTGEQYSVINRKLRDNDYGKKKGGFFPPHFLKNILGYCFSRLFPHFHSCVTDQNPKPPSVLHANSSLLKGWCSCLCDHKDSFCDTNAASWMLIMWHTEQISKNIYAVVFHFHISSTELNPST